MNNLTTRGWIVLVVIPSLLSILLMWEIASNLWYVGEGGDFLGYCWGTAEECFREGGL